MTQKARNPIITVKDELTFSPHDPCFQFGKKKSFLKNTDT